MFEYKFKNDVNLCFLSLNTRNWIIFYTYSRVTSDLRFWLILLIWWALMGLYFLYDSPVVLILCFSLKQMREMKSL